MEQPDSIIKVDNADRMDSSESSTTQQATADAKPGAADTAQASDAAAAVAETNEARSGGNNRFVYVPDMAEIEDGFASGNLKADDDGKGTVIGGKLVNGNKGMIPGDALDEQITLDPTVGGPNMDGREIDPLPTTIVNPFGGIHNEAFGNAASIGHMIAEGFLESNGYGSFGCVLPEAGLGSPFKGIIDAAASKVWGMFGLGSLPDPMGQVNSMMNMNRLQHNEIGSKVLGKGAISTETDTDTGTDPGGAIVDSDTIEINDVNKNDEWVNIVDSVTDYEDGSSQSNTKITTFHKDGSVTTSYRERKYDSNGKETSNKVKTIIQFNKTPRPDGEGGSTKDMHPLMRKILEKYLKYKFTSGVKDPSPEDDGSGSICIGPQSDPLGPDVYDEDPEGVMVRTSVCFNPAVHIQEVVDPEPE